MQVKEDTIFVAGLPPSATASQIGDFFGQIGIIKVKYLSNYVLTFKQVYCFLLNQTMLKILMALVIVGMTIP